MLKTPLQVIESQGIPTTSYIRAIQYIHDKEIDMRKDQYERTIQEIIGCDHPPSYDNEKESKIFYKYTIQETIRAFHSADIPDMEDVWNTIKTKARQYIVSNPWSVKDYITDDVDIEGNVKQKNQSKKVQAEYLYQQLNDGVNDRSSIIDALIEEIGLTKSGAPTYFHNLRKKFGYKGPELTRGGSPTTRKKGGKSKSDIAKEVYVEMKGQDRKSIIAAIAERADTSQAGANTYYCKAKKELSVQK